MEQARRRNFSFFSSFPEKLDVFIYKKLRHRSSIEESTILLENHIGSRHLGSGYMQTHVFVGNFVLVLRTCTIWS